MITTTSCRDCAHHTICAFQSEYKRVIDTITNIVNLEEHAIDLEIRITISCPHFMKQVAYR